MSRFFVFEGSVYTCACYWGEMETGRRGEWEIERIVEGLKGRMGEWENGRMDDREMGRRIFSMYAM